MIRKLPSLAVALLVAAGACGRGANHDADTALNNDLSLAAQAKAYRPLDSMSAAERGLNGTPAAARPMGRTPVSANRMAWPSWEAMTMSSCAQLLATPDVPGPVDSAAHERTTVASLRSCRGTKSG